MRMFLSLFRAPLWFKAVLIVLIVGGGVAARNDHVAGFIQEKTTGLAQVALGKALGSALGEPFKEAAARLGVDTDALIAGQGPGSATHPGAKTVQEQTPAAPFDWSVWTRRQIDHFRANPHELIGWLSGLILVYMILALLLRRLLRGRRVVKAGDAKMATSVDLPGFDLDAAFADPKAAPDMAVVLGQENSTESKSLRSKPSGPKVAKACVRSVGPETMTGSMTGKKAGKKAQRDIGFFTSRRPSAQLRALLDRDPFDRLQRKLEI